MRCLVALNGRRCSFGQLSPIPGVREPGKVLFSGHADPLVRCFVCLLESSPSVVEQLAQPLEFRAGRRDSKRNPACQKIVMGSGLL